MRSEIIQEVYQRKIITIVRGVYNEQAVALGRALLAGGIGMIEVTFDQQHPDLWEKTAASIRSLRDAFGREMVVGAGTVTSVELVEKTYQAGGQFIVSPDTNQAVIAKTRELGMVSLPGALTPTEVITGYNAGADFVKVFPSAQLGPEYIRAIRAPLNHIPMLAVGGVNEKNAAEFIAAGCSGIGVGGNLVNRQWIAAGEFEKITALAKEYLRAIR
ncbi:MAG: thiamine phosphate synthase [Eubacteriales bacterium]|nr:thiamine phosphate synthase [Eubacteriales bacterium]